MALVGKGITFDSGGLSLKPADGDDGHEDATWAGAAAVIAAMCALPALDVAVRVRGVRPA